jgi:formylmethanofuran dehydrogenase subunit B
MQSTSSTHDAPPEPIPPPAALAGGGPAATHAGGSLTPDWTCPFCPLHCDDISIAIDAGGTLTAPDNRCPRLADALTLFGPDDEVCPALVDGQPVALEVALDAAARILANARRLLFGGMATDVAGARALFRLAARCSATVDHVHGDALMHATLALQDRGSFFTTLSEVRTRADLLIFIDSQPGLRYPEFYRRTGIYPRPTLPPATPFDLPSAAPAMVFVGCAPDPALDGYAEATGATLDALLPGADPYDVLAILSALLEGRPASAIRQAAGAGSTGLAAPLAALAERIRAARYPVFVCEPARLPGAHAALLIEALQRIVKAVNRTTRGGSLLLGGDDGAASVNQTFTWLSGVALRTRVSAAHRAPGGAALDYDPHRYRTERLLAAGEVDALLWVSSFGPQPLPAALDAALPTIVLGHPALAAAALARGPATIFLPVATPGIDTHGHLFRTDGTVVVPLRPTRGAPGTRSSKLHGVDALAGQCLQRLDDMARAPRGAHP